MVIKITIYLVVNVSRFIKLRKMVLIISQGKKVINHQFFFQLLIHVHVLLMLSGVVALDGINVEVSKTSNTVAQFQRIVFILIFLMLLWLVFKLENIMVKWLMVLFPTNIEEYLVQD